MHEAVKVLLEKNLFYDKEFDGTMFHKSTRTFFSLKHDIEQRFYSLGMTIDKALYHYDTNTILLT